MHHFGHIEIPTTDLKKAKKFFGKIFGWTFQDMPDIEYVLFRTESHPNGGFFRVKKMPKKGQVNVYIEVADIDSTLREIRKARGKPLQKRTPVGTMGWFAQFATPDGCLLYLWESAPKEAAPQEPTPQI